jgi:hypothetical protein
MKLAVEVKVFDLELVGKLFEGKSFVQSCLLM